MPQWANKNRRQIVRVTLFRQVYIRSLKSYTAESNHFCPASHPIDPFSSTENNILWDSPIVFHLSLRYSHKSQLLTFVQPPATAQLNKNNQHSKQTNPKERQNIVQSIRPCCSLRHKAVNTSLNWEHVRSHPRLWLLNFSAILLPCF